MSVTQQNSIFIDPEGCGSSVGYYITVRDYEDRKTQKTEYSLSATVVLTDCSHKIDWNFDAGSVDKIDAAIAMLREFRTKYVAMDKMVTNKNK